jgi:hypothetical protein
VTPRAHDSGRLERVPQPEVISPEPARSAAWYARTGALGSGLHRVSAYLGAEHPDGTWVDLDPADLPSAPTLWATDDATSGLLRVSIAERAAPGAPPLWYVWVDEPRASPVAANLVAFADDRVAPGTIVDRYAFASMGVPNDSQAGAIRWYRSGVIHQIFVGEAWRRRQVGTCLLYAASAFHQANGWPGHLRADGRRTELGERMAASLKHPQRVQPLTDLMPPMDPAASAGPATGAT